MTDDADYVLDTNFGFLLRRAQQINSALFTQLNSSGLTNIQFAVLCRLVEEGATSQNALGRRVNADAATIKGVVNRLEQRGAVATARDDADRRQLVVRATAAGIDLYRSAVAGSEETTRQMLRCLSPGEQLMLIELLTKVASEPAAGQEDA